MRALLYILPLIMLLACSKKKELMSSVLDDVDDRPEWVKSRPISSFDYIGIGKASKRGSADEYQAIARRNALNDMASEIDVTVSSNSLLYTLERNDMLSESFSESIITRSNLRLEGFEVSDDYSDEDYYWVYYRLERSLYESILEQRKQEAIERAEYFLKAARQARMDRDVSSAAARYTDVLREMQPYWGEVNTGADGRAIDKVALDELLSMRSDYGISVREDAITLDISNNFRETLEIRSTLNGELTKAVTFEYRFDKLSKQKEEANKLSLMISPGQETQSLLSIIVDPFKELRKEMKKEGLTFLEDVLKPEIHLIDIYTVYPLVSLTAEEEDINGQIKESVIMTSALIKQLAIHEIGVDETSASPFRIKCIVKSRDGGQAQNFQIVYSDISLEAFTNDQKIVYSTRIESVKGVHKDMEKARLVSLEKCGESIDQNVLKPLLDAMF